MVFRDTLGAICILPGAIDKKGITHSLCIEADRLSIDFGNAPIMAFWDLLHLLDVGGAKSIRVTSSRAEAGNE